MDCKVLHNYFFVVRAASASPGRSEFCDVGRKSTSKESHTNQNTRKMTSAAQGHMWSRRCNVRLPHQVLTSACVCGGTASGSVPNRNFFCRVASCGTEVCAHAAAGNGGSSGSDLDLVACLQLARVGFQSVLFCTGRVKKNNHTTQQNCRGVPNFLRIVFWNVISGKACFFVCSLILNYFECSPIRQRPPSQSELLTRCLSSSCSPTFRAAEEQLGTTLFRTGSLALGIGVRRILNIGQER